MARPLLQQPLHAGWRFRAADARLGDTEQFTAPDGWHAATVPGTVYQDLIDSGALPDPLVGPRTVDQLAELLDAEGKELVAPIVAALDDISGGPNALRGAS